MTDTNMRRLIDDMEGDLGAVYGCILLLQHLIASPNMVETEAIYVIKQQLDRAYVALEGQLQGLSKIAGLDIGPARDQDRGA
ncbi:MAG: hypothetical protein ACFCUQ_09405 [Kiloniellales bacterium]